MSTKVLSSFQLKHLSPRRKPKIGKSSDSVYFKNPPELHSVTRIVGYVDLILSSLELFLLLAFLALSVFLSQKLDVRYEDEGTQVHNVLFLVLAFGTYRTVFALFKCYVACILISATEQTISSEKALPKVVVWRTFKIILICLDVAFALSDEDDDDGVVLAAAFFFSAFIIKLVCIFVVQQFILKLESTPKSSQVSGEAYGDKNYSNNKRLAGK